MAVIVGACLFSITYQQGPWVRSSAEAREKLGSGAEAERKAEDIQLFPGFPEGLWTKESPSIPEL